MGTNYFTKNWKLKSTIVGLTIINIFGGNTLGFIYNADNTAQADVNRSYFNSGSTIIPHPEKAYKGGEDALTVRDLMIAVADGVGGWANHGVDVAKYSKQLMRNIGDVYDQYPDHHPKEILTEANSKTTETGTSTAVIAILHPENHTIVTTVLGDSSYLLVRPEGQNDLKKIFRSQEQQKRFNFPYQCGTGGDDPQLAFDNQHSVKHNDIVVMGSDGLYDNCFDEEVIDLLKPRILPNGDLSDPQEASEIIARLAEAHGVDKTWRSPFQVHAEEAFRRKRVFNGGKQDDIAVIVSQIKLE